MVRLLNTFRRPRGHSAASPQQAAFYSPLVLNDGRRPRWVTGVRPINEHDSGWRFYEGDETDEWLNEPGNCLLSHLGHAPERWPELARLLTDTKARSAWVWDPDRSRYVERPEWADPD
jgi:hypothetical protein